MKTEFDTKTRVALMIVRNIAEKKKSKGGRRYMWCLGKRKREGG